MQRLLKHISNTTARATNTHENNENASSHINSSSQSTPIQLDPLCHPQSAPMLWTRVHSHFVLMGGIAIDFSKTSINIIPTHTKKTRLHLTTTGVAKIAEYEPALLNRLTRDWIEDRSKADDFAKVLVCLEAIWSLVQIIGRLATQHPISVLELSTAAHALCCIANYVVW
jgi:hypothetical protein